MKTADLELIQRLERITGKTVEQVQAIQRGYTPAKRLIITFTDGSSLFAKVGTNDSPFSIVFFDPTTSYYFVWFLFGKNSTSNN